MQRNHVFDSLSERPRARRKIADVFDVEAPDSLQVDVYTDVTPYVPKVDPNYVFDLQQLRKLLRWLSGRYGKNLLLTGPTGCGKSSLIEQMAARMGLEVFRVACHGKMEFPEILGSMQLVSSADAKTHTDDEGLLKRAAAAFSALLKGSEDGESLLKFVRRIMSGSAVTQYVYGPAANAASRGRGGILLLDEANFLQAACIGGLNTVLDNGVLQIPETGEVIVPKPMFRIAVTGNAIEGGDDIAHYRGVQRMNLAFLQRFLAIKCDYLSEILETKLLGLVVGDKLPGPVVQAMLTLSKDVRASYKSGVIEAVISTRTLLTWAKLTIDSRDEVLAAPGPVLADNLRFALLDAVNESDGGAVLKLLEAAVPSTSP